ncbi:hypothetical protein NJ76_29700 [Rhodococcus sp. IITR03]|nr:hypothetical protein NJ76_29700 [Rhodococcus sp. IITR03]
MGTRPRRPRTLGRRTRLTRRRRAPRRGLRRARRDRRRVGSALVAMGHSLGAATVLTALASGASSGTRFAGVVLCGTPRTAALPVTAEALRTSDLPVLLATASTTGSPDRSGARLGGGGAAGAAARLSRCRARPAPRARPSQGDLGRRRVRGRAGRLTPQSPEDDRAPRGCEARCVRSVSCRSLRSRRRACRG